MLRTISFLSLFTSCAIAAGELPSPVSASPRAPIIEVPSSPSPAWTAFNGIKEPESVCFDVSSGIVFVVNVVGRAGKKEGLGWITKLAPDGKVVTEKWVTGLNAPRGIRSVNGMLWVSDIDELVGVSIADGAVKERVKIDGAKFLNDVATHPDGTVYVSDTAANKIFAVKNSEVSVFAEGDMLDNPNGLVVDPSGGRLVVASWGSVGQKRPGSVFQLDLKTKEKKALSAEPLGNLNGLESDGKGGFIVSDSISGKVFRVHADGKAEHLMQFSSGCGDLFFMPELSLLIVPVMTEGVVSAFSYKP
jgi:hypothetical protein